MAARNAPTPALEPERLLGIILFGNNVVNWLLGTVATLIAIRQFGEIGVAVAPFVLTFVFLVFAEVRTEAIAANSHRNASPSRRRTYSRPCCACYARSCGC